MPAQTLIGLAIVLGGLGSALSLVCLFLHGARWTRPTMADQAAALAAADALKTSADALKASTDALTTAAAAAGAAIAAGEPDTQPLIDVMTSAQAEVDAAKAAVDDAVKALPAVAAPTPEEPATPVSLTISPTSVTGTVGTAPTDALTATGGTAPYTFAADPNTTTTGASINADGSWSTPTAVGTDTFLVTATDSSVPPLTGAATVTLSVPS